MSSKGLTAQEYFQSLNIIYIALLSGMLITGTILFFLRSDGQSVSENNMMSTFLLYGVPLITFGGILGGAWFSRNRLSTIQAKGDVNEKLGDYRSLFIVRLALLEGPAMIALICFFVTGSYLLLACAALIIFVYLAYIPGKSRIMNELDLSQSERAYLDNPNQVVAEVSSK